MRKPSRPLLSLGVVLEDFQAYVESKGFILSTGSGRKESHHRRKYQQPMQAVCVL